MTIESNVETRRIDLPMLGIGSDLAKLLVRAAGLEWGKDKVRSIECRVATSEAISFTVEMLGKSNEIEAALERADELCFPPPVQPSQQPKDEESPNA